MSNLQQFQKFKSFTKPCKEIIKRNQNCVIYTRVSDSKQKNNTSLESQKKYCVEYAERTDLQIVGFFGNTNDSAKTEERKEFQKMMKFVKARNISNIIVYSLDRYSRAGIDSMFNVSLLKKKGVYVHSATQYVDHETAEGELNQYMAFLWSKYDNDKRRTNVVRGMKTRLTKGRYMGRAPFGYSNARTEDNTPIIVKNKDSHFIKKIFEWKVYDNLTNTQIAEKLAKFGLKIHRQKITKIFKNVTYCGLISNSLLDGQIIKGKHEAIVTEEMFLKANGIQAKIPQGYRQNKANESLPLKGGFLKCEKCKKPLTGYIVKKKNIYYYKCNTKGCCINKNANKLNNEFKDILSKFNIDKKLIAPLKVQLKNTFDYFNNEKKDNTANLKASLKTIQTKIDKIEENFVLGIIDNTLYTKHVKKFNDEKELIIEEIEKVSFKKSNLNNYIKNTLDLLSNLPKTWELANYTDKQKLQTLLFPQGISYNKENDSYRTFEVNSILQLTNSLQISLGGNKKGQSNTNVDLSRSVLCRGIEPLILHRKCSVLAV